jgi:hypothetical protein
VTKVSSKFRSVITQFAILLLLVPALLPQGMMMARDNALGQIVITMCSGVGGRNVWLDLDTGRFSDSLHAEQSQTDEGQHANSNQLCPFAAVAAVALPDSPSIGANFTTSYLPNAIAPILPYSRFRGGRLPPRGPPLIS